ncbi:acyltransferase family protein [Mucilaginibacter psychrotolerans]|uniref:Acyltransferase n=1 Tax=Mucilaginibacter psychrotolerans TaxID=1524096 RepID=A0A4Y8S5P3_9SPHI|nr:acyltransferase [Mucilaginibacter psychrotolerans]TFF33925.1 acyltransferase [Mucilaginibacter psychrotolerans]
MPQTLKQRPHIPQVDYIRAFASMAVALFHLGGKVLPVLKYGWLGVYMFFVLSGFIICRALPQKYSWRMAGRFIGKRMIRIEPPYLISIALVLLVNVLLAYLSLIPSARPEWGNLASHIAYLNNFNGRPYVNPVYWTLGIELQFYLFVALMFPFIASRWGAWLLLALNGLSCLIHLPGINLFAYFPVFALGILYYLYRSSWLNALSASLFMLSVAAMSYFTAGWMETAAALAALLLLWLPLKRNRVLRFFSDISFSLYLTHDTVGSNLVVYMGQVLPKTFLYKGAEFAGGILVSILFAYLFYKYVEQPFLKLSKSIAYT